MKTTRIFGPADHGREVTEEELNNCRYEPGHQYEIIDGKFYVSPRPHPAHNFVEMWLYWLLTRYSDAYPDVLNYVTNKARVFVPTRRKLTAPEPDIAAYNDFPFHSPIEKLRWEDLSPILVAEIMAVNNPEKDLERNMALYLQVPSIREYWIIDTCFSAEQPTLLVYRRHGRDWRPLEFGYGETYTTRLLPGFSLLVDPKK